MKKIFFLLVLGMYPSAGAVIKSVPAVSNVPSVYFDKTAYAVVNDQPMLFLGSATELITTNPAIIPNETNFALARLVLENNNETEQTAAVQPLAPAKVTLNGGANLDNPLLAKKVKHLGLYKNSYPIVVPETPATNAQSTSNQFFVVTDVTAGTKMLGTKDSGPIKDAANADVTTVLANVAGGNDFVFVAVPDATASSFGAAAGVNRGVAILKEVAEKQEATTVSSFQQLNALDIAMTTEVPAAKIFVDAADQLIAFSQGGGSTSIQSAVIGDDVVMCWDETLQRLYVGFSNVERDDAAKEGGVMDIIMGFVDTTANIGKGNSFTLSPFVYHPTKDHFYDDQNIGHDYDVAVYNVMEQMDVATAAASAMSGNALNVVNAVTPVPFGTFPVKNVDGNTLKNMDGDPVTYATLQANKFKQTYASLTAVVTAANTAAGNPGATATAVRDAVNAAAMDQIIALRPASKNAIKLESINTTAVPFGMYFDGTTPRKSSRNVWTALDNGYAEITLSAPILKTMHTSAGRPYLLFNGVTNQPFFAMGGLLVGGSLKEDRVYAIPLVGDIVNEEPETKGSVAKVTTDGVVDYRNGRYDVPTKISEMPLKSHNAVAVGGQEPVAGADIKDIFVQGDSVFMALAGFDNDNLGIFKSTAILNAQGFIVDWTPAERVMGSVQKAYGGGLDTTTGNFYFLGTQNDADPLKQMIPNAGQITTWGLGDASLHGNTQDGLLSTQLGALFSASTGGVHQIFNFDENTPSFYRGCFSMMVAVGSRQLVLIETGSFSAGEFVPTANFADTIYVQTDPLLTAIAPLRCVAITQQFNRLSGDQTQPDRNPATGQSLMFVGGYSGVVKGTATDAANEKKGLLDVSEITWSNTNLTDIKDPVIKIVALPDQIYVDTAGTRRVRNGALYVLTNKKLYRRTLNGAANGSVAVESGNDLVVARDKNNNNDVIFVATPQGLLWSVNVLGGSLAELRTVFGGGNETLQLDYLSGDRNGVPQLPGNLYALIRGQRVLDPLEVAENEANDIVPPQDIVTQLYRFAVIEDSAAGTISAQIIDKRGADVTQQVAGPLVQYDEFRSNFSTDGALLFNTNPKDQTSNDFVRVTSISTTTTQDSVSNDNSITAALNVDLDKNYNVGTIVRDSASGAWVVPGDWGVRVNE